MEKKVPQLNSFKTIDRVVIDLQNDSAMNKPQLPQDINKPLLVNKIKPVVEPPNVKDNKINYDTILSSMGIKMVNGKLELFNKELQQRQWNPYTVAPPQQQPKYNQKMGYKSQVIPNTHVRTDFRKGQGQGQSQGIGIDPRLYKQAPYVAHNVRPEQKQEKGEKEEKVEEAIQEGGDDEIRAQQLKRIRLLNYLRRVKEVQRLNQVKSRKLLFNNPNVNISISRRNAEANKLFRFVGVAH